MSSPVRGRPAPSQQREQGPPWRRGVRSLRSWKRSRRRFPDDLASLRPEDIRVEAEFADLVVTTTEPIAPAVAPPAEPAPEEARIEPVLPVPLPEPAPVPPRPRPSRMPCPIGSTVTQPTDAGMGISLPAINIEPPRILPPGREIRSVQEVVLQPATVMAWSLLVLMALPMAFLAGLLIGHFVWK